MSELQISLIGMGVLAVAGIWLYNKLQERKLRRAAERVFQGNQADALLPTETEPQLDSLQDSPHVEEARHEPSHIEPSHASYERIEPQFKIDEDEGAFGEPAIAQPQVEHHPEDTIPHVVKAEDLHTAFVPEEPEAELAAESAVAEALLDTHAPASGTLDEHAVFDTPSRAAAQQRNEPPLAWSDPLVDYIATFVFPSPQHPAEVTAGLPESTKPIQCVALSLGNEWIVPDVYAQTSFTYYRLGLQTVDRRGVISEAELAAFHSAAKKIADKFSAKLEIAPPAEIMSQAQAIDEFCAQLDVQLAVNIIDTGKGAFPGTKLRGLAEAAGMLLQADGRFYFHDEDGRQLFSMADLSGQVFNTSTMRSLTTHGISLVLDVPRVAGGALAFDRMVVVAKQMANALGGQMVNAQRAQLVEPMIVGIRAKILEIQKQMAENLLPAGGERALRLFS